MDVLGWELMLIGHLSASEAVGLVSRCGNFGSVIVTVNQIQKLTPQMQRSHERSQRRNGVNQLAI